MAVGVLTAGMAAQFAILSFDDSGRMVFNPITGATNYQVWTAPPAPTGTVLIPDGITKI